MPNKNKPNVVMIVLDTHRVDRLMSYGYPRETSPHLHQFAEQATVFEHGISAAQWTIPSHAAMFTGEYPTTHQTLQAHQTLDNRFDTIATLLSQQGYQTTGFCNNPLVGVLNNGLKRGFDRFYNYSGAVPSVPRHANRLPMPLNQLWEWYTQQLRKLSYPVQNLFAHSDFLFQLALNPVFVPLWTKLANFKGDTAQSLSDAHQFVSEHLKAQARRQFVFVNLMETHLPFMPPTSFIDKFAPYFKDDREIRDFIRKYNAQAYRWLFPLEEPFQPQEAQVMSDIYDAEVAYQDALLGPLLQYLSQPEIAANTLTIIVGDHGEGLGEHDFMGHSFVAYQELVHVPLIIKFPGQSEGRRVPSTVSTRRIFHTVLEASNVSMFETEHRPATDVKQLSLARSVSGADPEQEIVYAEAYAPNTFLSMMEANAPHLMEKFHCRLNRRAVFQGKDKLVRIDGVQDELFDLESDPLELKNRLPEAPEQAAKLTGKLDSFMVKALARRPDTWQANKTLNLEENETIARQLRSLGYMD
jgi:uncharacterized sulfatase